MFDQISETATPKDKLPQFLDKIKDIKMVATKPAKVSRDIESDLNIFKADLPIIGALEGNLYETKPTEIFARTITNDKDGIKSYLSFKTELSGRADYFLPMIFKVKNGSDIIMSTIMTKGSGSLKALKDTGSPFAKKVRGEIEGAASISDIRLDAKNSKRLHELGIRTRVALGVYSLDEIEYEGKTYSPEELMDKKIIKVKENLPGIGVFASRSSLRIEDIESIIRRKQPAEIDALIGYIIRTTQFDDAREFQEFYQKHKKVNENFASLSLNQRDEIIDDYILSLSSVLGRQAAKFERIKTIKVVKGTFGEDIDHETPNNITCLGESVDNSQLVSEASVLRIAEYQKSLLSLVLSIPPLTKTDFKERMKFESASAIKFIDGYLDELVPGWQKSMNISESFLTTKSEDSHIDQDNIRRAYFIIKLKQESITNNEKSSDLANATYSLLYHALDDDSSYTKSEKFITKYLELQT